jgi:FKBP-type peptidyl-prolyl cis-trans isomerase 2
LAINIAEGKGRSEMIEKGKKVKFDYQLTVNGKIIDSSEKRGPLEYIQGEGAIIKGLEKRMEGLKVGDKQTFIIPAEEAYGKVNPSAFQEVPKSNFPKDLDIQAGQMVEVQDNAGNRFPVVISEIKEQTIILNFNHPLAGQELTFDVTIVDIQ